MGRHLDRRSRVRYFFMSAKIRKDLQRISASLVLSMKSTTFENSIDKQRKYSVIFEKWLDNLQGTDYLRRASHAEDLEGIDFVAHDSEGKCYYIQLKVDFKADKTGNLPFEVVSQAYLDRRSVIGCQFHMPTVNYIAYLLVPSLNVYLFDFRSFLTYIIQNYPKFRNFVTYTNTDNKGYWTLGGLIPINDELLHICRLVDKIEGDTI